MYLRVILKRLFLKMIYVLVLLLCCIKYKKFNIKFNILCLVIGYRMDYFFNVVEIVFIGLCCRLGILIQVIIRREIMDILEIILSLIKKGNSYFIYMISGSYRDGFRFELLDLDMMFWYINNKVICEMFQFMGFYVFDENIIFMEYLENFLGFVKLKLFIFIRNLEYLYFLVVMYGKD